MVLIVKGQIRRQAGSVVQHHSTTETETQQQQDTQGTVPEYQLPPPWGQHQITPVNIYLGTVWANQEFCWTSVPKNANSRYRLLLDSMGIHRTFITPDLGRVYSICVVRDPRTRVISAMGEYAARKGLRRHPFRDLMNKFLSDPTQFDEHLERQVAFLAGKSYTHILKFENLYAETLQHPFFRSKSKSEAVKHWLDPGRWTSSKHFRGADIRDLYRLHSDIIDIAVRQYYTQDWEIWQDPQSWIGKVI